MSRVPLKTMTVLMLIALAMPLWFSSGSEEPAWPEAAAMAEMNVGGSGVFLENRGQYDPDILFVADTAYGRIGLSEHGVRHMVMTRERIEGNGPLDHPRSTVSGWCVVEVGFSGANPGSVIGEDRVTTEFNFLIGRDPSGWATGVRGFEKVVYRDIWEGIDLVYRFQDGALKYDIILSPGADPNDISFTIGGDSPVRAKSDSLAISTALGVDLVDSGLRTFYRDDGSPIGSSFVLRDRTAGFHLAPYDDDRTVVIDPEYRVNAMNFSTYIGGSGYDEAYQMDRDPNGNIYIVGTTESTNFPVSRDAYQPRMGSDYYSDAFVFKLDPTGKTRLFCTYIGGEYSEYGSGIAVDEWGTAFIAGQTDSEDFPTTAGAYNTTLNNQTSDLFLLELDRTGTSLLYSTYIGGSQWEDSPRLDIDAKGMAYVVASTSSDDFPVTSDAYQKELTITSDKYGQDMVLFMFDLAEMDLLYSTYYGGSGYTDYAANILHVGSGNVLVCGYTDSLDFPVTKGAYQTSIRGWQDGFVFKFDLSIKDLVFSTYFGGSYYQIITDLVVNAKDEIHACGLTASDNLPVTNGANDTQLDGWSDGFVVTFDPACSSVLACTYVGGSGDDQLTGIDLDKGGRLHLFGNCYEIFDLYITDGSLQEETGGGYGDCFYVHMKGDLTKTLYSTYLGGSSDENSMDIILDRERTEPILLGNTGSSDFPTKAGCFDTTYNGAGWDYDVFVTRFNLTLPPTAPLNPSARAGDGFVEINWETPSSDGGGDIDGYVLFKGTKSGALSSIPLAELTGLTYNDTDVTNGKTYYYGIRARNWIDMGPLSDEVHATPASIPSSPKKFEVKGSGDMTITLGWIAPDDDGGFRIDGYNLFKWAEGQEVPQIIQLGLFTSYEDLEVENGILYHYHLTAFNVIGESLPTPVVNATPMTIPGQVIDLRLATGAGFVHLYWSTPDDNGGSQITNYTIYRGTGTPARYVDVGAVNEFNDTAVTNGQRYTYRIRALNSVGYSSASEEVSGTPLARPSPPRNLSLIASHTTVDLSWGSPLDEGGAPVTEYRIYRTQKPDDWALLETVEDTAREYKDRSVQNGRTYHYMVTAVNSEGESEPAFAFNATPMGRPGAPMGLTITWGDGYVVLAWEEPLDDGGSPLTGYRVMRGESPLSLQFLADVPAELATYNDTKVVNGKTYYYMVRAFNAIGDGAGSDTEDASPAGLPSPPSNIKVVAGDGQVDISWSAPSDTGGLMITQVKIYRGTDPSVRSQILSVDQVSGSYRDLTVANGITYYYSLTAVNALDEGPHSSVQSALPLGKPGAPMSLSIVSRSADHVEIGWTAPITDGGSMITNYRIYRSSDTMPNQMIAEVGGETLAYKDDSVKPGTTYIYKVTAVNTQGEGPASDMQTVDVAQKESVNPMLFVLPILVIIILAAVIIAVLILTRKGKDSVPPGGNIGPYPPPGGLPMPGQYAMATGQLPGRTGPALPPAGIPPAYPAEPLVEGAADPGIQASMMPVSYPPEPVEGVQAETAVSDTTSTTEGSQTYSVEAPEAEPTGPAEDDPLMAFYTPEGGSEG